MKAESRRILSILVFLSCLFVISAFYPTLIGRSRHQRPRILLEGGRISPGDGLSDLANTETLLDEDDPILGLPNINESSSSTAVATTSVKDNEKKSLGSDVGAAEVENLLQALENKEAKEKKKQEEEDAREKSSGVSQLLDEALRLIGKVPNAKLRELFELESNPPTTVDGHSVPITSDMSCETHFRAALEVAWKRSDGDWANLITDLRETLGPIGEETTRYMTEAVGFANEMKEEDIKKLIRKYDGVIPKLNTKLYEGKLLKGDYIATLVDLLREQQGGDYSKVKDILEKECKVKGKGNASNKGFAKK